MRDKFSGLSLAARISLVAACFLAAAGATTAIALYQRVRTSLKNDLEARCLSKIAALQSSIEVDDGRLELEQKQLFDDGAANSNSDDEWEVSTADGKVLWSRNWTEHPRDILSKSKLITAGEAGTAAAGSELKPIERAAGENPESNSKFYRLPPHTKNIQLRLSARTSVAHMRAELNRLSLALWTIGPIAVLAAASVLALFVRWQLTPLSRIAREAALIGPENVARIGEVGTSVECVRLRESINRMVERLAAGLERERCFASMAAHELRTPVAQLRTNIEVTLRKERVGEEYRQAMNDCLADVERLQNLIASLLLLTRQQAAVARNSARLDRVVERARKECASSASISGADTKVEVQGNEDLLTCAVRNVLENAQRYARDEAARILVHENGDEVVLAVADSGPGIPQEQRDRIFEPLVRLDSARTIGEKGDGFGLGLTVARAATRACGGDLTCKVREDGRAGAEFCFRLKRAAQS